MRLALRTCEPFQSDQPFLRGAAPLCADLVKQKTRFLLPPFVLYWYRCVRRSTEALTLLLFWTKPHHSTVFSTSSTHMFNNIPVSAQGPVLQGSQRDFLSGLVFQPPYMGQYCSAAETCRPTLCAEDFVPTTGTFKRSCESMKNSAAATVHRDKLPPASKTRVTSCSCFYATNQRRSWFSIINESQSDCEQHKHSSASSVGHMV